MKPFLNLPRGGRFRKHGKQFPYHEKKQLPSRKSSPSGELARKRLRGSYNTTYRRTPK